MMVEKEDLGNVDVGSVRSKALTLFTLFFPSIILVLPFDGLRFFIIKILVAFYQIIMLNAFIDTFYDIK